MWNNIRKIFLPELQISSHATPLHIMTVEFAIGIYSVLVWVKAIYYMHTMRPVLKQQTPKKFSTIGFQTEKMFFLHKISLKAYSSVKA